MHIYLRTSLLLITLATTPVAAADFINQAPEAPQAEAVPETFSWAGFYMGGQAGGSFTKLDYLQASNVKANGGTVGAYGGYNFQTGNIVYGIENDINYNWGKDSAAKMKWDGSARGRLGYAMDQFLIYGSVGMAVAGGTVDIAGVGKSDKVLVGWTVGAGTEYAVTSNFTVRADYRYSNYGKVDFGGSLGSLKADQHRVTVGVGYKF